MRRPVDRVSLASRRDSHVCPFPKCSPDVPFVFSGFLKNVCLCVFPSFLQPMVRDVMNQKFLGSASDGCDVDWQVGFLFVENRGRDTPSPTPRLQSGFDKGLPCS